MHAITAKLISLEHSEKFLAYGWPQAAQSSLAERAKILRRELPPQVLAVYDQLRANGREAVVHVSDGACGGCRTALTRLALARLEDGREVARCEHCGRFIYLAGGRDRLSQRSDSHANPPP